MTFNNTAACTTHLHYRQPAVSFFYFVCGVEVGNSLQCSCITVRTKYKTFPYSACKFSSLSLLAFAT